MIDRNWARWIFASVSYFFKTKTNGLDFFVEGEDEKFEGKENYLEFRMNGPIFNEYDKGCFNVEIVVNILVVSKQNGMDIHTVHRNVGIAAAAFESCIPVMKYGDTMGIDDPTVRVGILIRKEAEKKDVVVNQIGQVAPDVKEMQAMVEGYYCMTLEV
jgi:hypothetical protein